MLSTHAVLCCSAELESRNSGKPLPEALWDLDDVSACYEYYATLARELDTKQNEPAPDMPQGTDYKATMRYEAAGVGNTYTYQDTTHAARHSIHTPD